MSQINAFDRFWNSTFGVGQQLIWRFMRAAQDDEVSLFSRDGLLDPSLIPGLGIFAKDRRDVTVEEATKRFGGNDESFGSQFAVSVLTDPLTYMTAGLSASAKGARAAQVAIRNKKVFRRSIVEGAGEVSEEGAEKVVRENFPEKLSQVMSDRDSLVKALEKTISEGGLKGKEMRQLSRAKKHLQDLPENISVRNLFAKANERDLVLSLPFLQNSSAKISVAPGEKSWFKFLNRKSGVSKAAAHVSRPLSKIPIFGAALETLGTFGEGLRGGGKALRAMDPERMETAPGVIKGASKWFMHPGRSQVLGKLEKQKYNDFGDAYAKFVALSEKKDFNIQRALVATVDGRASKNPQKYQGRFAQIWNAMGGGHEIGDDLRVEEVLKEFMEGAEKNRGILASHTDAMRLTEVGKREKELRKAALGQGKGSKAKFKAFKFGRQLRQAQRKMFSGEASFEELLSTEESIRRMTAQATEQLQQFAREGAKLLRQASQEWGVDPEVFDQFMNSYLQMSSPTDELMTLGAMADPSLPKTASTIGSVAARMRGASDRIHELAQGAGASSKEFRETVENLTEGVGRGYEKAEIAAAFDAARSTPQLRTMAELATELKKKTDIASDLQTIKTAQGETLIGLLTDAELESEMAKLAGKTDWMSATKLDHLDRVQEARRNGLTEAFDIADLERYKSVEHKDARFLEDVAEVLGRQDGETVVAPLDRLGEVQARLMGVSKELDRVRKTGGAIGPALVASAVDSMNAFGRMTDEILENSLGEAGKRYFGWLREIQGQTLNEAIANGVIGPGMGPIAYVGRIIGPAMGRVESALNKASFAELINKRMPTLGSSMLRNLDALTVEELNDIYRMAMEESGPAAKEFVELMDEIAMETTGVRFGKYTESPHLAMLTRLAQGSQRSIGRNAFSDALKVGEETGAFLSGKVVGVVDGTGRRMTLGSKPTLRRAGQEGKTDFLKANREEIKRDFKYLVIEGRDGKEHLVGQETLGSGTTLLNLGKYDGVQEAFMQDQAKFVERGLRDQIELAAATRASRGPLAQNELLNRDADLGGFLDDFLDETGDGAYVMWGGENEMTGPFTALQKQYEKSGEVAVLYDLANQTVKAWQTTFRPAFHMVNLASMFGQLATVGVKATNTMFGAYDSYRFLNMDPKKFLAYDRVGALSATEHGLTGFAKKKRKGLFSLEAARVSRRKPDFQAGGDPEIRKMFGLTDDQDLVFRASDGKEYEIGEILDAVAEGGLLGTFVTEGLRGSSRASQTLQILRNAALKENDKGKIRKILGLGSGRGEATQALTESSEIFARFSGVFAQLREGIPLQQAVENTKLAMVDYANITQFERKFLKRYITYYTFPRHYLPQAARYFDQDPKRMATLANAIRTSGVFREGQYGQVEADLGKLGVADFSRMNPNVEAVKLVQTLGHIFLTAGTNLGPLDSTAGRESRMLGAPDQPFSAGSLPSAAWATIDGNDRTRALDELSSAFWVSRFMLDEGDPLGEKTPFVRAMESTLFPVKQDTPKRIRRNMVGRYTGLMRELRRQATVQKDPEDKARIVDEMQRLNNLLQGMLEEVE